MIDAVVVTHNSEADLRGFVASEAVSRSFNRVLVVDNNSSDGTVDVARRADFQVIQRGCNDGFGAAANVGIACSQGETIALLNPDIRLGQPDVIGALVQSFADSSIGLVAPALELPSGTIQDSAREVPMPWDLVARRMTGAPIGAIEASEACDVPWVVGAFMLIRRAAFNDVSGFDPMYRLYFEDVDLCVRLRDRGWNIRFDPQVRVRHEHRASSRGSLRKWTTRQHIKSAAQFYWRYRQEFLPWPFGTAGAGSGPIAALPAAISDAVEGSSLAAVISDAVEATSLADVMAAPVQTQ